MVNQRQPYAFEGQSTRIFVIISGLCGVYTANSFQMHFGNFSLQGGKWREMKDGHQRVQYFINFCEGSNLLSFEEKFRLIEYPTNFFQLRGDPRSLQQLGFIQKTGNTGFDP